MAALVTEIEPINEDQPVDEDEHKIALKQFSNQQAAISKHLQVCLFHCIMCNCLHILLYH
jgi:hypothetical protein